MQTDTTFIARSSSTTTQILRRQERSTLSTANLSAFTTDESTNQIMFPLRRLNGEIFGVAIRNRRFKIESIDAYRFYCLGGANAITVFNLHQAVLGSICAPLVVVEDVLDLPCLFELGLSRVVALMGTRITKSQIEQLHYAAGTIHRIVFMHREYVAADKYIPIRKLLSTVAPTYLALMPIGTATDRFSKSKA
jgi:DNA primase